MTSLVRLNISEPISSAILRRRASERTQKGRRRARAVGQSILSEPGLRHDLRRDDWVEERRAARHAEDAIAGGARESRLLPMFMEEDCFTSTVLPRKLDEMGLGAISSSFEAVPSSSSAFSMFLMSDTEKAANCAGGSSFLNLGGRRRTSPIAQRKRSSSLLSFRMGSGRAASSLTPPFAAPMARRNSRLLLLPWSEPLFLSSLPLAADGRSASWRFDRRTSSSDCGFFVFFFLSSSAWLSVFFAPPWANMDMSAAALSTGLSLSRSSSSTSCSSSTSPSALSSLTALNGAIASGAPEFQLGLDAASGLVQRLSHRYTPFTFLPRANFAPRSSVHTYAKMESGCQSERT
mmetsp:Transcript_54786/g.163923  ORF Transcript_54786/g.163923 Transcript_54786/m.163923 type:complete len:349 (+) Transcript_54786:343-1389(+)